MTNVAEPPSDRVVLIQARTNSSYQRDWIIPRTKSTLTTAIAVLGRCTCNHVMDMQATSYNTD